MRNPKPAHVEEATTQIVERPEAIASAIQPSLIAPSIAQSLSKRGHDIVRRVSSGRFSADTVLRGVVGEEAIGNPCVDLAASWDLAVLRGGIPTNQTEDPLPELRIADFFCGCGGMTAGLHEAAIALGFAPVTLGAFDQSSNVLSVYRRNFAPRIDAAINLYEAVEFQHKLQYTGGTQTAQFIGDPFVVAEELALLKGRVDVLIGGPPCQGHSTFNNKRRFEDPRNVLYLVMPAAAIALGVDTVIIENVPNVLNDKSGVVDVAKSLFRSSGYYVVDKVVDGLRLGIPQTRKRHLLIASRGDYPDLDGALASAGSPMRDLEWAISDLVDARPDSLFDRPASLNAENLARIMHLIENDEFDMPNHIRPESHKNGHTYPSVYGRLRWDRPAGTITTGFSTPGRGRFIHPSLPRTLTPHEAARIQGFSDAFEFAYEDGSVPSRGYLAGMIGEAVPPKLGYVAGLAAIGAMSVE